MKHVVVIGGGVAGIEASKNLSRLGYSVSIIEKTDKLGGKLNQWDRLFPNKRPAAELLAKLKDGLNGNITRYFKSEVVSVSAANQKFDVALNNGNALRADAVLVTTGFDLFDARKKEEYGYGIYDNVITSADLEETFRKGEALKMHSGETPRRVGFIHCVGSRDEKAGHTYCSKVCCVTAVKQAVEVKQMYPDAEVFCFYMDLRMFGRHFEDLYKEAQVKYGVQFVRGRLSEAFENPDGSLVLKVEDTLLGKPLKLQADVVVLMAGMTPSANSSVLAQKLDIEVDDDGFLKTSDLHYDSVKTKVTGIFTAGTCNGPRTLGSTINEARTAALQIAEYLS